MQNVASIAYTIVSYSLYADPEIDRYARDIKVLSKDTHASVVSKSGFNGQCCKPENRRYLQHK